MSLAHDKDLITYLLKLAQQGSLPAPEENNAAKIKDIAEKMINNIIGQLDQGGTITADRANADLNMKNLVNLQALLTFIQYNGIRYNGLKLSIPHTKQGGQGIDKTPGDPEFTALPPEQQKLYVKYPEVGNDADNFQFYLYKDGIEKYLEDLLEKAGNNTPEANLMRPAITALVNQVNQLKDFNVQQPQAQNQGQGQTEQQGQGQPGALVDSSGGLTEQGATAMMDLGMPLTTDQIDLNRIGKFTTGVSRMGLTGAQELATYVEGVITAIRTRYPLLTQQDLTNVNFVELSKQISDMSQGKETSAQPYMALLSQLLSGTQRLLQLVWGTIRDNQSPAKASLKQDINDQLTNVYPKNLASMRMLEGQLQRAMNVYQSQSKR